MRGKNGRAGGILCEQPSFPLLLLLRQTTIHSFIFGREYILWARTPARSFAWIISHCGWFVQHYLSLYYNIARVLKHLCRCRAWRWHLRLLYQVIALRAIFLNLSSYRGSQQILKTINERVIINFRDKSDVFFIFMIKCHDISWFVMQCHRVAGLGRLSAGAKMGMKPFVKRVSTIFATNASFLRVISNFLI